MPLDRSKPRRWACQPPSGVRPLSVEYPWVSPWRMMWTWAATRKAPAAVSGTISLVRVISAQALVTSSGSPFQTGGGASGASGSARRSRNRRRYSGVAASASVSAGGRRPASGAAARARRRR